MIASYGEADRQPVQACPMTL